MYDSFRYSRQGSTVIGDETQRRRMLNRSFSGGFSPYDSFRYSRPAPARTELERFILRDRTIRLFPVGTVDPSSSEMIRRCGWIMLNSYLYGLGAHLNGKGGREQHLHE